MAKWNKLPDKHRATPGNSRLARLPDVEQDNYYRAGRSVYSTYRWRLLSQKIRKAHPFCCVCGETADDAQLYADHIIELADGGPAWDAGNIQVMCAKHHKIKSNTVKRIRKAEGREIVRPAPKQKASITDWEPFC